MTYTPVRPPSFPAALVAAALLAAFAWLTPTHQWPWPAFHAEFAMAAAAGVVVAWTIGQQRRARFALSPLALLTFGAALIPWLQLAAGRVIFFGDACLASLYLLGFALAQVVGQRIVATFGLRRPLAALAGLVLFAAVVSVWFALCQWQRLDDFGFLLSDLPVDSRPYANFNQPNLLATFLVLGLLSVGVLRESRCFGTATASLLVVFLGFGLAMTQSRAGFLEVVVVAGMLLHRRTSPAGTLSARTTLTALALLLAAAAAWQLLRDAAPAAPSARDLGTMFSAGARGTLWAATLDAVQARPWAGHGWNEAATAQYLVAPDHPAEPAVFDYTHNLVLDLLVWNGIPLGLVLIAGLGLWFATTLRGLREPAALFAFGCVTAVFVHAMVEYPLYYTFFMLPVGALMGGLSHDAAWRARASLPAAGVALLTIGACVAALAIARDYVRAEDDVLALRYQRARIVSSRPPHSFSRPLLMTQLGAVVDFARHPERRGMSAAELDAMENVARRFPSNDNLVRFAAALAINGRRGDATAVLRRVCKVSRPPACQASRTLWQALGRGDRDMAAAPWPAD